MNEADLTRMENAVNNQHLNNRFAELSTPLLADACLRLRLPLRVAPSGIRPLRAESHVAGQVLPVAYVQRVPSELARAIRKQ